MENDDEIIEAILGLHYLFMYKQLTYTTNW